MVSTAFQWLDHSDKDRRRVLDAIDRFNDPTARDELGLANIRDGFADYFFPGTSVLMTHARYFFFVPWMYLDLERKGPRRDATGQARNAEVQMIETLGDTQGNIGRLAKGTLKRLPSSIYWLGLDSWGIRRFDGTQAEYHALLERGVGSTAVQRDDDGDPLDGTARRNWHASLPSPTQGYPKKADFTLSTREAAFLKERIELSCAEQGKPASLMSCLFRFPLPDVPYAWHHPHRESLPNDIRHALDHAQCVAEAMQGAALLYNLMLARARKREDLATYEQWVTDWGADLAERHAALREWRLAELWSFVCSIANVHPATINFVNEWVGRRPWEDVKGMVDDKELHSLIERREVTLKRGRARLSNPRALELWGGASGMSRLTYRWRKAYDLVNDIVVGLAHA